MRKYARKRWPIVIVDTANSWLWDEKRRAYDEWATSGPGTVDKPRLVKKYNPRLLVQGYVPATADPMKDPGLLQLCRDVMKNGKCLIYFDETFGIMTATFCPEPIAALWVRGRKKFVAAWAGSQRPSRVPEVIMSQSENWAVFRLLNPKDLEKVADWLNSPEVRDKVLPLHYWWYWNEADDAAQLMRPIA